MPAQWTCEVVGKMHMARITKKALAAHMGVTREYVTNILNGHLAPKDAEARIRAAVDALAAQSHDTTDTDR